jgi:hypothetical protein
LINAEADRRSGSEEAKGKQTDRSFIYVNYQLIGNEIGIIEVHALATANKIAQKRLQQTIELAETETRAMYL